MKINAIFKLLRQTPNRGRAHVFLGDPYSDLCDKTTVEPGNTYSPGVWTCGVTFGLLVNDQVFFPDVLPEGQVVWGFGGEGGSPPRLRAAYQVEGVNMVHDLVHLGGVGAEGVDFNHIILSVAQSTRLLAWIAVRSVGPAGGKISKLEWQSEGQSLLINQAIRLVVESPDVVCYLDEAGGEDPLALLYTEMNLQAGESAEIRYKTEHGFDDRVFGNSLPKKHPHSAHTVASAFEQTEADWRQALPARLCAPDRRVELAWQASAYHILAAMEGGLPRIGAVNYPIFWMRDGVIILRALDLIGRHDLARLGNDYLQRLDFSGGFGAESDSPGEGIWALVSHAQMFPDRVWLQEIFPHIQRRVGYTRQMLIAKEPLRMWVENRTTCAYNSPASSLVCLPAQNGCIHGRMDWHSPDFYINCWALAGFRQAAWVAGQLGESNLAAAWLAEAEMLERNVAVHLLPNYGNDRDPAVVPYPTEALIQTASLDILKREFTAWFQANRLDEAGQRRPEKLWTYFEAAQIHNAIRLGYKDLAWAALDGMLADAVHPWNVAAWVEGMPGGNEYLPFGNNAGACGWLSSQDALGGNMPHNWTSAEIIALLRTIFVHEDGDILLLGAGVPPGWFAPGSRFGVCNMPTRFGMVSYTVNVDADGKPGLDYEGAKNFRTGW